VSGCIVIIFRTPERFLSFLGRRSRTKSQNRTSGGRACCLRLLLSHLPKAAAAAAVQHNAHNLRIPKHEGLNRYAQWTEVWPMLLLLLINTTRTSPDPQARGPLR